MTICGTDILVRTMSKPTITDKHGNIWNYHSRSDHHSKVACWGIMFDLLQTSGLLRKHVADGKVAFGINHEMRDFKNDRKKNLDLVICIPARMEKAKSQTLATYASHYKIDLSAAERTAFDGLPTFREAPVGHVLLALEAKACMTAHQRALPRLYDELNSSHLTVHGADDLAIAAGFVMINIAERFLSPDLNKKNRVDDPVWSTHVQPKSVNIAIKKVEQLPRRSRPGTEGYDALAIVVVDCINDGSPVKLHCEPPAPKPHTTYHYGSMIDRLRGLYDTRFAQL
jgi:hypothetical protein